MTIYGREGSSPSAPNFELKISLNKFMCICINCEFYNLCWIKKGLNKIPKVYTNSTLKINLNQTKFGSSQLSTSLFLKAHGVDNRALEVSRQRKSLAIETTLAHDISTEVECRLVITELYQKLLTRLAPHANREIIRQGVKLKFTDFNQTTVETQTTECQQALFVTLLAKAYSRANQRGVRLIGLTLGFADNAKETQQLSFAL